MLGGCSRERGVPGSLEILAVSSSGMLPPPLRLMVVPSAVVNEVPPSGPPVPARDEVGSLERGQPNWFMKLGMTRWKVRPS